MHRQGLQAIETRVTESRAPYRKITVRPISPSLGAEVSGVDLTRDLSDEVFAEIRRAFREHQVLVFRDQNLTAEDHKRFGRRFGPLHVHALQAKAGEEHERLQVRATKNSKFVAGEGWHADVTCDAEPPMASMLHIVKTPDCGGGDTLFANMCLAFDLLSEPMQHFLQTLTAVHDGAIPWTTAYGIKPDQPFNCNEHPVVVRHPETGRRILYVNRGFTSHIKQLTRFESAALLEMLYQVVEKNPAITCRVTWQPNTLVMWDNRCTQHHALWDYFPMERNGFRVSIVGERPQS